MASIDLTTEIPSIAGPSVASDSIIDLTGEGDFCMSVDVGNLHFGVSLYSYSYNKVFLIKKLNLEIHM
jgi:hypothetical protein